MLAGGLAAAAGWTRWEPDAVLGAAAGGAGSTGAGSQVDVAALRGQGARSQVVMASAARSGEPEEAQADGAAPNRPGKKMKFSPIRRTAWVGGDASRTAPDRAGGARFGAMSMVLGFCSLKRGPTQIRAEGCRRGHLFRAVVALRAAICASPAGLLHQKPIHQDDDDLGPRPAHGPD